VRHARKSVERDVVLGRVAGEHAHDAPADLCALGERARKRVDGGMRGLEKRPDLGVALGVAPRVFDATLLDLVQAMAQRVDEKLLALRVLQKVVLQVGIALDDPDVAQHLEQHARRPAGAALAPQLLERAPHVGAKEPDDDLAIGERGVVVGDLPQPGHAGVRRLVQDAFRDGVHENRKV
jgi:hypothetical protein